MSNPSDTYFCLDSVVAVGMGEDPNNRHCSGTGFTFGNLPDPADSITGLLARLQEMCSPK